MRKFALLLGIVLLLFGIKLWDDGLYALYKEYPSAAVVYTEGRITCVSFTGGKADALRVLEMYGVKKYKTEMLPSDTGAIYVYYGASPYLFEGVAVNGGYCNIQVAFNPATGRVTAGTPLITGSY